MRTKIKDDVLNIILFLNEEEMMVTDVKKNKVYNILQELIGFNMTYLGYKNKYAIYEISYDAKRLIENWNEIIYRIMDTRCIGHKIIVKYFKRDISDYNTWRQWCVDKNTLTLDLWYTNTKSLHEYRYKVTNSDYLTGLKSEFIKKVLNSKLYETYI